MLILEKLKDFISNTRKWEVDTKYEYYRNFLRENNIKITDYDYIITLERELTGNTAFDMNNEVDLLALTDNMILKKGHKKKLKELYKKCQTEMEELEAIDVRLLTSGSYEQKLPESLEVYINTISEDGDTLQQSVEGCYNMRLRRHRQLSKLINNYNRRTMIREFYYTENDIEYILTQILKAPRNITVKENLDSFSRIAPTPATNRVLIAVVLFLLEKENLIKEMDKPLSGYLTRTRLTNLKEFLSNLIK